jgi:hypothetical protein
MAQDDETLDPAELPEDPTRTAKEAAGAGAAGDDDGPDPEKLDEDPAYGFDEPESESKGG